MRAFTCLTAAWAGFAFAAAPPAEGGSERIVLQRLSGSVGYETNSGGKRTAVAGQLAIDPRDYALTSVRSMAALDLPDSSVVSIGESTRVQVGRFQRYGRLTEMRMNILEGAVHFSVQHPQGAHANYVFVTPTSEIAIRGTEGVIVVLPGETIVACVHGTPNDTLVITKDGSRMYVPIGQTVRIRAGQANRMQMARANGISGPEFSQFAGIIARNHAMRMRRLQR